MDSFKIVLATALALAGFSHQAYAATLTQNMQVNTQVNSSCIVNTQYNLDFGQYDATGANNTKDAVGMLEVSCVKFSPNVRISFDQGQHAAPGSTCASPQRRMRTASGEYLVYNIYGQAARTAVRGCESGVNDYLIPSGWFYTVDTKVTVGQFGRIPANQDVKSGSYTDTIGVTVSF